MGGGIRCEFKGETDAVVMRGGTPYFGRVGHVLEAIRSSVILWFRDEPGRKLVSFPDAAVFNVDGALPILLMEHPWLDIHVLVLKGLYGGMVGRAVVFETRRSSLVSGLRLRTRRSPSVKMG
jgi:hypothetical protein